MALLCFACKKGDKFVLPDIEEIPIICEQSACWDNSVYVCRDSTYNDLFTRSTGWTGGDATYSVDLLNGKTLWMFGDTFINQVSEDRSRPSFNLINNSVVLQEGLSFETIHGGTQISPQAFAQPPEMDNWYWPGDATVANGKLYMFMHGFGTGGGAWDFFRTSVDLLTVNLTTLEIENNQRLFEDPEISWGAVLLEDTDYTYIYGVKAAGLTKYLYVARSNDDLTDDWEYFGSDAAWSDVPTNAVSIFNSVSEQFSIFKDQGTYYFLTQGVFESRIYLYTSASPLGEFDNEKVVYCTPETNGDIFTYNAFAHSHIYSDSLLVSYNINSLDFNDLLESADNYRPYFVKIGGWRQ